MLICSIMLLQPVDLFSVDQSREGRSFAVGHPQAETGSTGTLEVQAGRAAWIAGDLHFAGRELTGYQPSPGKEILVFQDGFAASIGQKHLSADNAVVWLESVQAESGDERPVGYKGLLYLRGDVSLKNINPPSSWRVKESDLQEKVIEGGQALVVRFDIIDIMNQILSDLLMRAELESEAI